MISNILRALGDSRTPLVFLVISSLLNIVLDIVFIVPLQGGVAGAAREALNQVTPKALGMSVGGKIGIARSGEHVAVAVFFNIGLGHLDEVCVGLGHRAI